MKRSVLIRFLGITIICMLCISACGTKETVEKNDITGISIETLLDQKYPSVKSKLENAGISLEKNEVQGAYSYSYEIDTKSSVVHTDLQFWNMNDPENEEWEKTPEKEHSLVSYHSVWNWTNEEYTEEIQKYIVSIYSYYEEKYGVPNTPEKFDKNMLKNGTVLWKTSEKYQTPDLEITFYKDGNGACLDITHKGTSVMEYREK